MHEVKVIKKYKEAQNLYLLKLKPTKEIYAQYQKPGQYGIFSLNNEKKLYFAFANAPLIVSEWEILIKNVNEDTNEIINNDFVYLESVEGQGFPLDEIKKKNISAFAMGSGIAPIRALIQFYLKKKIEFSYFELWMSAFSYEYLPFKKDFAKWEKIFPVYYVFDKEPPFENVIDKLKKFNLDFSNKTVLWIGSKEYGRDLKQCLLSLGLKEGQFFSNV